MGSTNGAIWSEIIERLNAGLPAGEQVENPFANPQPNPPLHGKRKPTNKRTSRKKDYPGDLLFMLQAVGLTGFVKEHMFAAPDRRWRLDLAHVDLKIGVECHGGVWTQGRHTRGQGFINDREKMNDAVRRGWLVLEFTPETIKSGEAVDVIQEVFINRILEFAET